MKTKNPMQLKSILNKKGIQFNILAQMTLQHYVMERFLDRMARSSFRQCFILKGGLLITTMIGMAARTTLDMDVTVRGLNLTPDVIRNAFKTICDIPSDDDFTMEFVDLKEIREEAEYPGLRVSLTANYERMKVPFTMDVTTGDAVTPEAVEYDFPLLLEDGTIKIKSYNLETVLAEKLDTIMSRMDNNTRMRDFYDAYALRSLYKEKINEDVLKMAFLQTSKSRNHKDLLTDADLILKCIIDSTNLQHLWNNYRRRFSYAKELDFQTVCSSVVDLVNSIKEKSV